MSEKRKTISIQADTHAKLKVLSNIADCKITEMVDLIINEYIEKPENKSILKLINQSKKEAAKMRKSTNDKHKSLVKTDEYKKEETIGVTEETTKEIIEEIVKEDLKDSNNEISIEKIDENKEEIVESYEKNINNKVKAKSESINLNEFTNNEDQNNEVNADILSQYSK